MEEEKRICKYCGKAILAFKKNKDWLTRAYHHVCWQKKFEDFARDELMRDVAARLAKELEQATLEKGGKSPPESGS